MGNEDYEDGLDDLQYDSGSELSMVPLLAAAGAALVGAIVWAGITLATNYEVGYVAWAIGGLVGIAAVKTGGRGTTMAVLCAALALLSILGGKLGAVHMSIENEITATLTDYATPELFAELEVDARDYAALPAEPSEEELTEFIFSHRYTEAESAEGVSEEDVASFEEYSAPLLVKIQDGGMTIESWRTDYEEQIRASIAEEGSLLDFVIEGLNAIDLLFAVLGISTAFGLVRRAQ